MYRISWKTINLNSSYTTDHFSEAYDMLNRNQKNDTISFDILFTDYNGNRHSFTVYDSFTFKNCISELQTNDSFDLSDMQNEMTEMKNEEMKEEKDTDIISINSLRMYNELENVNGVTCYKCGNDDVTIAIKNNVMYTMENYPDHLEPDFTYCDRCYNTPTCIKCNIVCNKFDTFAKFGNSFIKYGKLDNNVEPECLYCVSCYTNYYLLSTFKDLSCNPQDFN